MSQCAKGSPTGGGHGQVAIPWWFRLASGSDHSRPTRPFGNRPTIAASPPLFLCKPLSGVWSHAQPFPAYAVQVDKTVAKLESLKKLLIIWLMCIRLWAWEINRQPRAELLKWVLVSCLLSLGNGFSCLHHPANRCRDAVCSLSRSQEQPVARQCLLHGPAAWAVCNMDSPLLRTFQLLETALRDRSYPDFPSIPHACTCACTCPPDIHTWTHTHSDGPKYTWNIQRDFLMPRMNSCPMLHLNSFFRNMLLTSKRTTKRKENLYRATFLRGKEKFDTSH